MFLYTIPSLRARGACLHADVVLRHGGVAIRRSRCEGEARDNLRRPLASLRTRIASLRSHDKKKCVIPNLFRNLHFGIDNKSIAFALVNIRQTGNHAGAGSSGQPGIDLIFWPFPFLLEFVPPKVEKQLLISEKENFIPFFINPDCVRVFLPGFDIKKRIHPKEARKPFKAELELRCSPLV